jgi:hypothetical protein
MYFNPPINGASTNDLDLSCECQGRVTDYVFRATLEHYARLEMPIYTIYKWIPINIVDDEVIYNITTNDINIFLPKIVKVEELEGEICGQIYCHAVGTFQSHRYINKPVLNYEEAKNEFVEKCWLHMKIG